MQREMDIGQTTHLFLGSFLPEPLCNIVLAYTLLGAFKETIIPINTSTTTFTNGLSIFSRKETLGALTLDEAKDTTPMLTASNQNQSVITGGNISDDRDKKSQLHCCSIS